MAIYIIAYDLHRSPGAEYDALFAALETIGTGYWDCLESTWLVVSEKSAVQIRELLKPFLRDGDHLLVVRCGEEAAWLGFKDDCETWLEDYL